MKRIIQIIFIVNLALFLYGVYLQYLAHNPLYAKVMGSGVLLLVFVLMPLFLYDRYKDKNIDDYKFKSMNNENEDK